MKYAKLNMSGIFQKTLLASALVVAPALSGFVLGEVFPEQTFLTSGSVQAQNAQPMKPNPEPIQPRRLPGQSQRFVEDLQEVIDLADPPEDSGNQPNINQALQELNELVRDQMEDLNPFEKAMIHQVYAQIHYEQENMDALVKDYENILAQSPNIPPGLEAQVLYTLGQLYLQEDEVLKGLDFFRRWAKMTNTITPDQYYIIGQAFYQNEDTANAKANVLEAIRLHEVEGKIPKEEWLAFMRAIYYFEENYPEALKFVEQLVRHYPKMSYWKQMASLYYELGRLDDYYRALDTIYVMGGVDKENEILGLAGYFIENDAPYKAAKVLDKGMNQDKIVDATERNLEMLANSWRLAQERDEALKEMQRAAAKSDDGELYYSLARLLFAEDRFEDSVKAARNALEKGGLRRPDQVQITIGQAEIERGNFDAARKAFDAAAKDDRSRRIANQWKQFADTEEKRNELVEEFL